MSRTRRIYNSEAWRKKAIRFHYARYNNVSVFHNIFYGIRPGPNPFSEELWAGPYCYTRYKVMYMRCGCGDCERAMHEKPYIARRARKLEERKILKTWRQEIEYL